MPKPGGFMSVITSRGRLSWMNTICFLVLLTGILAWIGCESSEATREQQDQQALSSIVGEKKPELAPPQPTADQKKIEELEAENASLKQKITKLEQDNGTLSTRLSEIEAKILGEREQAEKALAAKTAPPAATSYENAAEAFKEKKYDEAIQMYQALLDGGAAEELADNCHYWLGESYFGKKDFAEAMKHFEMVFQYKASEKKGDAQFMIAQCFERTGDKAKAKEAYEKVVKDYPTSDKVKKAKERWGKL
jgi:tol-pal system protein YbgF